MLDVIRRVPFGPASISPWGQISSWDKSDIDKIR
jgi:hypothetical protein